MSTKYKFLNPDGLYMITFAVVGWVDIFTRDVYRQIILDSFKFCIKQKGLVIHAWVLMTNHVHLIISRKGDEKLENILRDMKKHTSVKIIDSIENNIQESRKEWMLKIFEAHGKKNPNNTKFQFWQQGNHPVELTETIEIEQKLNYIHNNPVVQGFTTNKDYYNWSSAIDYSVGKGLIDIEHI